MVPAIAAVDTRSEWLDCAERFHRLRFGRDDGCCLFANHVHRAGDEEARNAREYRRVDHAQSRGTVDLEVTAQDATARGIPDPARARCVMTPGAIADELLQAVTVD